MLVEIEKAHSNPIASIRYNENKMNGAPGIREAGSVIPEGETGHILATRNVPDGRSLIDEFDRLEELSKRKHKSGPAIINTSFHASINPGPDDPELSDEQAVRLIDEMMKEAGYGGQPYRIYKHTDIDRGHYHVVSTRAGQDAKKIEDSFERLKWRSILLKMQDKYGYNLTEWEDSNFNPKNQKKETIIPIRITEKNNKATNKTDNQKGKEETEKKYVPAFNLKEGPVTEQMRNIHVEAMKWHFTTFEQFQALMNHRFHLIAELSNSGDLLYQGVDTKAKTLTHPIAANNIGEGYLDEILRICRETNMKSMRKQRERLDKAIKESREKAESWYQFEKALREKGIIVVVSFTDEETPKPFGITWIDRATRCIWKGSETTQGTLDEILKDAEKKGWKIEENKVDRLNRKRGTMPSRLSARAFDNKNGFGDISGQSDSGKDDGGRALPHIATRGSQDSHAKIGKKKDDIYVDETERLYRESEL